MHVLLFDPFTNKFDDVSPGRLLRQVAQLCAGSLALPVFRLSGPDAVPSWGRHCYEQLTLLPGFDDRAMTCPWILVASYPVASYGLYTHAFWQLQELSKLTNLFEDRQSTPERTLRWLP